MSLVCERHDAGEAEVTEAKGGEEAMKDVLNGQIVPALPPALPMAILAAIVLCLSLWARYRAARKR
jgi:hypothetical protein